MKKEMEKDEEQTLMRSDTPPSAQASLPPLAPFAEQLPFLGVLVSQTPSPQIRFSEVRVS